MALPMTTDATFADDIRTGDVPVLVEFTAEWCPPCRMIAPVLEQIAADNADRLRVLSIDVDADPGISREYGVMSMPSLLLFVDGRVVHRSVGARPRAAILRDIEPYLSQAAAAAESALPATHG